MRLVLATIILGFAVLNSCRARESNEASLKEAIPSSAAKDSWEHLGEIEFSPRKSKYFKFSTPRRVTRIKVVSDCGNPEIVALRVRTTANDSMQRDPFREGEFFYYPGDNEKIEGFKIVEADKMEKGDVCKFQGYVLKN